MAYTINVAQDRIGNLTVKPTGKLLELVKEIGGEFDAYLQGGEVNDFLATAEIDENDLSSRGDNFEVVDELGLCVFGIPW